MLVESQGLILERFVLERFLARIFEYSIKINNGQLRLHAYITNHKCAFKLRHSSND